MRTNSLEDWQRLTQLYREMSDEELYELDDNIRDLTEVAQQVLRDEMRTRGLKQPSAAGAELRIAEPLAPRPWKAVADTPAADGESKLSDQPHEFTWKVLLCECDDREQAWQIQEVLRQAGIESWMEGQGYRVALDLSNPRIQVAADQLELAREVISRPIPPVIIEQSSMPVEEFKAPVCPGCGAEDPVLESADPVNAWRCESCGKQWTDPAEEMSESYAS